MTSTKNQELSSKCCFGCIILIIGISLTVAIPTFASISVFLIVIGVIVIVVEIGSKTRDISKRPYPIGSRMQRGDKCPWCGKILYVSLSGDKRCYNCGYEFLQKLKQMPTPSEKKVDEYKIPSDESSFPPITELLQYKKTSKLTSNDVELKTEEIKTVPEKKRGESFKTCPHCRQKLPLGSKFCARCGQKIDVLKPIPTTSAFDEGLPKEIPTQKVQMPPQISGIIEIDEESDLNWLKYQYYDLGRSLQNIADELGVSMIRIRNMLSKIEVVPEKKEAELKKEVLLSKTEEIQPSPSFIEKEELAIETPAEEIQAITPISKIKEDLTSIQEIKTTPSALEKKVEKTYITCPHCGQKLGLGAKFCASCGLNIDVLEPIPPKLDMEEITEKKVEKPKKELHVCKFCGMRIPKNNTFCIQCGMVIKTKIT
ncbi:MAG: zinc ribbon domain-containing protein [Candidatus Hodarchaeota archaeon]